MINLEALTQIAVLALNLNITPTSYPECDWSTGQTRWAEQLPDGSWETYPLGNLPSQCHNPAGDNKINLSGTVYQTDSHGAPLRGIEAVFSCPRGSTGFQFSPVGGEYTLYTFSGGLHPSRPEVTNSVAIYDHLPQGVHAGRMIFGCYTKSGNLMPLREVEAKVNLQEARPNVR